IEFELDFMKNSSLGPIGKLRTVVKQQGNWNNLELRNTSHSAQQINNDERRRERRFAFSRARRRQPLFLFSWQDRKFSLSGSLGRAEGAFKRHARNSNGDAASKVWSVSSVFLPVCSVLGMVGR
ncbi:MAG: hypothetical protein ABJQ63_10230, partial [Lentilitoribacter sp.]